jgi:hypothetical protein
MDHTAMIDTRRAVSPHAGPGDAAHDDHSTGPVLMCRGALRPTSSASIAPTANPFPPRRPLAGVEGDAAILRLEQED